MNDTQVNNIWDEDGYEDAPIDVDAALEQSIFVSENELRELGMPSPGEVEKYLKKRRITIMLQNETIERFKAAAKKQGTRYQTLISSTLDAYSNQLIK